jgi:rhamnogalacturonyl hydrolase YesR
MKKNKYLSQIFFLFLSCTIMAQTQNKSIDEVVELIDDVINWQSQQTDHVEKYTLTNWQFASYYIGMMKAFKITGNTDYQDYLNKVGEDHNWETLPDMYHADKIAIGQIYLDLYQQKGGTELIKNIKWVLDANLLRNKPKPNVRYDKNPYKHEWWSWCDALFMAPPTFAKMYQITGEEKYLDYAIDHWLVTTDYLWDKKEHLIYRDDRYFDKKTKSGKKIFWSRGNGWVFGGLVHMLEMIPENHPKRHLLVDQFQKMAQRLLDLQERTSDGLWRSNLLDPGVFAYLNREGTKFIETDKADIPENSGSAFFCYGFVWGINNGLLDRNLYEKPMVKAWKELTQYVNKEGRLGFVQPVGKDPKPYGEDSWQEFGTGAFLLAASEYINYLKNPVKKNPISYQKQSLFYQNDFSSKTNLKDWVLEGEAKVIVKNNWMEMYSPDQKSHHVFWCPEELPANFMAEWELQNLNPEAGLCIVFFAAKGLNGKDVMHSSQKKRKGIFSQYTKSDLKNYHISYYTNNPKKPNRPFTHMRKNKGFVTVQYGEQGIPASSTAVHKVHLVKKENHISMAIDGREVINWIDDGNKNGLAYGEGKFAFRQMQWSHFRYRNLKVWNIN